MCFYSNKITKILKTKQIISENNFQRKLNNSTIKKGRFNREFFSPSTPNPSTTIMEVWNALNEIW